MLETYFKSYFWTFQLAVLFAGGLLMARTVNAFVARALDVPPETIIEATQPRSGPEEDGPGSRIPTTAFLERNLFQAKREDLEAERRAAKKAEAEKAEAEAGADPESFDISNCTMAGVSAKLVATVVSTVPENSVAVFQTGSDEDAVALRIGDEFVDQGRVMKIEWRNVYLDRNNRCEIVSLDEDGPKRRQAVVSKPQKEDDDDDLDANVTKVKSGEYEIARAEIDNVLSNMSKLATQARIVPSFKNGKANGFKLFSIRPNSLYAKIGIQNGDIVQQINGYEINSPDKALEIYSKLKDAQTITVDLLRRGKSRTMTYNIR
jgi:general secretion pathway protein C